MECYNEGHMAWESDDSTLIPYTSPALILQVVTEIIQESKNNLALIVLMVLLSQPFKYFKKLS